MMVPAGRYFQNAVFITNSVGSTVHDGSEGGSVKRRRYKPALGELWRVLDVQLMFDILSDVYDDINTIALSEVPVMSESSTSQVRSTTYVLHVH